MFFHFLDLFNFLHACFLSSTFSLRFPRVDSWLNYDYDPFNEEASNPEGKNETIEVIVFGVIGGISQQRTVALPTQATVGILKKKIQEMLGLPIARQVLLLDSCILADDEREVVESLVSPSPIRIELTCPDSPEPVAPSTADATLATATAAAVQVTDTATATVPTATVAVPEVTDTVALPTVTTSAAEVIASTTSSALLPKARKSREPSEVLPNARKSRKATAARTLRLNVMLNAGGNSMEVVVDRLDKVEGLRQMLPSLFPANEIPNFYLFAHNKSVMDDSQSYSWNGVRLEGEAVQVLTQEQSPAMPYNINANLNVWVAQRGCDSKVLVQVHPGATVEVLKSIVSEHHLDFNVPARIFWNLFHEQKSTGLLFQLSNVNRSLSSYNIREEDILHVVPSSAELTTMKVEFAGTNQIIEVPVQVTDDVRMLRNLLIQKVQHEPLPQGYSLMYNGHLMHEEKPFYWHRIVGDGPHQNIKLLPLLDQSAGSNTVICNLPYLTEFNVSKNFFSGPFPKGLANCHYLEILDLCTNRFHGEMLTTFCKMTNLRLCVW
ncbi:hypothetical protein PS2_025788 [Malus domestica]